MKDYTITPDGPLSTDTKQIIVSYTEGEITKTAAVNIQVTAFSGGGGAIISKYSIVVEKYVNGSVSADVKTAEAGELVTLSVAAAEGYALQSIQATDAKGNEVALTEKSNGKFTFQMPESKVTVKASFVEADGLEEIAAHFSDVDVAAWYAEAIGYVVKNELMSGVSENRFAPKENLTHAMIAQVLFNLEDAKAGAEGAFLDVAPDAWYAEAVNWAASEGIVKGFTDGTFDPNAPVTCEQMATILYRYAVYKQYDVSVRGDLLAFSDHDEVSDWAAEAMSWAIGAKLFHGKNNGNLDPTGTATRAEVAQTLMNFCKMPAQ